MLQQINTEIRPPYVRFEKRAIEDRTQRLANGKYAARDIDIAKITVVGQKDTVEREAKEWLSDLQKKAEDGRVPPDWPDRFQKLYDFWQKGQEMPLDGTPIKGWSVLSPAQQENILNVGIFTVEDLAQLSDEAARAVGIGAVSLKQKAYAWLQEAKSHGVVAEENAALMVRLNEQEETIKNLMASFEELKAKLPKEVVESIQPVEKANF